MKRKLILGLALILAVTSITGCQAFKKKEVKTATELLKEYNKKDHKNYDAEMVVSVKLEENNGGQISNIDYNVNSQITRTKGYAVHPAHVAVAKEKVVPYTKTRTCMDTIV